MELSKAAQKSIAIHLGIELNEGLLDYLYLVFCISDGPLFSNRDDININEEFILLLIRYQSLKPLRIFVVDYWVENLLTRSILKILMPIF